MLACAEARRSRAATARWALVTSSAWKAGACSEARCSASTAAGESSGSARAASAVRKGERRSRWTASSVSSAQSARSIEIDSWQSVDGQAYAAPG